MRALAPLKDVLGWVLTLALVWILVTVVKALVDENLVRLALVTPGVILAPWLVSRALGLGWFSNLASWRYGATGGPFDP
jgi:hypothetical protein